MGFFNNKTEFQNSSLFYLLIAISSFALLIGALFQEMITKFSYVIVLIFIITTYITIKNFIQKK